MKRSKPGIKPGGDLPRKAESPLSQAADCRNEFSNILQVTGYKTRLTVNNSETRDYRGFRHERACFRLLPFSDFQHFHNRFQRIIQALSVCSGRPGGVFYGTGSVVRYVNNIKIHIRRQTERGFFYILSAGVFSR